MERFPLDLSIAFYNIPRKNSSFSRKIRRVLRVPTVTCCRAAVSNRRLQWKERAHLLGRSRAFLPGDAFSCDRFQKRTRPGEGISLILEIRTHGSLEGQLRVHYRGPPGFRGRPWNPAPLVQIHPLFLNSPLLTSRSGERKPSPPLSNVLF